jgi:acyl-homoserine lactone acylase PvdQ
MSTDMLETRQTLLVWALLEGRDRLTSGQNLTEIWGRAIPSPGSSDPSDWVWGKMHGLRLDGLVPFGQTPFQRPTSERGLPFYERPGGQFAVTPCDHGYNDFNFTCTSGSSLRMVHEMDPSGPVTYNALPGGYSSDPASPYFASEVEMWNRAEPRKLEDDRATLEQNSDDITVYGGE